MKKIQMSDVEEILQEPLSEKEKVIRIIHLLDRKEIGFVDDRMVYCKENLYDHLRYSSSIIEISDNRHYGSYLNDVVVDDIENERVMKFIVSCINGISMDEDRCVFVERILFGKKVDFIKEKYFLSNNGYYDCLKRAFNDAYEGFVRYKK